MNQSEFVTVGIEARIAGVVMGLVEIGQLLVG